MDNLNKNKAENSKIQRKTEIKGLKLSHIHGYRGFDCRDNLFYIDDGNKIVYPAAGAGVVLDLKSGKIYYFFILFFTWLATFRTFFILFTQRRSNILS